MTGMRGKRPTGARPDPVRSVRVSEAVWDAARRRATYEGVTMSHVMLTFVEGYARGLVDMPRVTVQYSPPKQAS